MSLQTMFDKPQIISILFRKLFAFRISSIPRKNRIFGEFAKAKSFFSLYAVFKLWNGWFLIQHIFYRGQWSRWARPTYSFALHFPEIRVSQVKIRSRGVKNKGVTKVKTYAIAAALLIDPDREGFFESFFSKIFRLKTNSVTHGSIKILKISERFGLVRPRTWRSVNPWTYW